MEIVKPSLFKTVCKAETSIPRDPIFRSLLKRKHHAKEFKDELDEEETDKLEELDSEELELEGSLLELDKEDELEEASAVVNDSVKPLGANDPVVKLYTLIK